MAYNYLSKANIKIRNRRIQNKWDNFGKLNPEEREVINETCKTLDSCLNLLLECQDMYISDLRDLDHARYKLKDIWGIGDELECLDKAEEE
jgi:hypothetical protein|tara:strand:+ start:310 stop:582 length:273 start_codon:yes stop_codon:yes gene_type:complete